MQAQSVVYNAVSVPVAMLEGVRATCNSCAPRYASFGAPTWQHCRQSSVALLASGRRRLRLQPRVLPVTAQRGNAMSAPPTSTSAGALVSQALAAFLGSAVVGTLCSMQIRAAHLCLLNPMHHLNASRLDLVIPGLKYHISTPWWIPAIVGLGGAVLAVVQPALDNRRRVNSKAVEVREPALSWAPELEWVLLGAALLVLQYRAVGYLAARLGSRALLGLSALDLTLALGAVGTWAVLDGTRQGLLVGVATMAVAASLELYLTGSLGLYRYTNPVLFGGLPSFLPSLHFATAPVAANFGRWLRTRLA